MKTYREADVSIYLFLNSKVDGSERAASFCSRFFPPEDRTDVIHCIRSCGGLQSWIQRFRREKYLTLPGIELLSSETWPADVLPECSGTYIALIIRIPFVTSTSCSINVENDIERAFNQSCLIYW
jgi:hypothetical protein